MSRPRTISDQALLLAARKIFLKQGVNAPVSAVAKELGVSVAALFFRMKSKENLLIRALLPPFPPVEVTLLEQEIPRKKDFRARLLELLTGLCGFLPEALPGFFLLHSAGVLPMQKHSPDTIDIVLRNALAMWLQKAKARRLLSVSNPSAAADAIIGAMEARFLHAYLLQRKLTATQNSLFLETLLKVTLGAPLDRRHRTS
jgi:AcrR family transcriptional regulator